jgi:hypothetical protein
MPHSGDALHRFAFGGKKRINEPNCGVHRHARRRRKYRAALCTKTHFVGENAVAALIPIEHEPVKTLQLIGAEPVAIFEPCGWEATHAEASRLALTVPFFGVKEGRGARVGREQYSGDSVYSRHSSASGRSGRPFDAGGSWLTRLN